MPSSEAKFQVSDRVGDAILLVRGDTAEEFQENLLAAADDVLLAAVDAFHHSVKSLAPVAAVKAAAPGSERLASYGVQASQAPTEGGGRSCEHGPRQKKSGAKNGKPWTGHFCAQNLCKAEWE